jgi:hypothetical protein
LPGESRADSTLSSGVATGSVATSSVATRFVALSDVATSGVVGGRVTGGSVAAALVAAGGVAFEGVVVHGDAWVCSDGACGTGPRVCTGVPVSKPIERLAGVDDGAFAAAAGVVTGTSCWPGFAEPLAGGPLVALNNPPGVDLLPEDTSKADAPFDSGGEAIVAAGATYAWRRDANALAIAIQPKK